ncbi:MAG: hypothetical protein OXT67_10625 [Zetaproteobacteria bacterium]|nr:hypothetical protein [Zetaproteobacteria bacterium]
MQKRYSFVSFVLVSCCTLTTCSQPSFVDTLEIHMLGVYEEPAYAAGDTCNDGWYEPFQQSHTILGVEARISPKAGGEDTLLTLLSEPTAAFDIAGRTQKVFTIDIATMFEGLTATDYNITRLKVTVSNAITVKSKFSESLSTSVSSSQLVTGTVCEPLTFSSCDTTDADNECSISNNDHLAIINGKSYVYTLKVLWRESIYRDTSAVTPVDTRALPPTLELVSPESSS